MVLEGLDVSDATLELLKGLNSVEQLSLQRTRTTDGELVHLRGPSHLEYLYLDNTTDYGLRPAASRGNDESPADIPQFYASHR